MAVTFDARFKEKASAQASPFTYTSGTASTAGSVGANSNKCLIAILAGSDPNAVTAMSMSWDGVGMTQIGTVQTGAALGQLWMFGLINPAEGSKSLSASWTGTMGDCSFGAISLYGVDQGTAWQNAGSDTATSTDASSAVTSANGNMAVVGHQNYNSSSTTINAGTSAWIETSLNGNYAAAYLASTGTPTTISWTLGSSVEWENVKVDVISASTQSQAPRSMHQYRMR